MIWQAIGWLMLAAFLGLVFAFVAPSMKGQWRIFAAIWLFMALVVGFVVTAAMLISGEWP